MIANGTEIIVASRYAATPVYTITATGMEEESFVFVKPKQLQLF
ncbi:MAG: hypothetical protein WDM90_13900 [Ferruginibacter sp.]